MGPGSAQGAAAVSALGVIVDRALTTVRGLKRDLREATLLAQAPETPAPTEGPQAQDGTSASLEEFRAMQAALVLEGLRPGLDMWEAAHRRGWISDGTTTPPGMAVVARLRGSLLWHLTGELERTDHGVLAHEEELRISLHPGAGCAGVWTVEVVKSPLSRRAIAVGHGPTLAEAAAECRWP